MAAGAKKSRIDHDGSRWRNLSLIGFGWGQLEGRVGSNGVCLLESLGLLVLNGLREGDSLHWELDGVGGTDDGLLGGKGGGGNTLGLVKLESGLEAISPSALGIDSDGESVGRSGLETEPPPICLAVGALDHPPIRLLDGGDLGCLGVNLALEARLADDEDQSGDAGKKDDAGGHSNANEGVPGLLIMREPTADKDTLHDTATEDTGNVLVELGQARLNQKEKLKNEDPAPGSDSHCTQT
jgi:hypothetical protein